MIGATLGAYTITAVIGEGGMGVVYAARHSLLGRPAAIKVLRPEMSRDANLVDRFFNEARAITAIRHPGIVEIYDFGHVADGMAYIAMEQLAGETLGARLAARRRLPVADALSLTRQIANALAAAHAKGVIHRDLKPDNVFLVRDSDVPSGERTKLLDFGIAKLVDEERGVSLKTRTGAMLGTPTYMSPEQARGAPLDHRADLYSLGCLLFEMLTGKPPFTGESLFDVLSAHVGETAPGVSSLVDVPDAVDALVAKLLSKHPNQRIQSCDTLIGLIDELVLPPAAQRLSRPGLVHTTTLSGAARSFHGETTGPSRRGLGFVLGAGVLVLAVAVALIVGLAGGDPAEVAPTTNVIPAAWPAAGPAAGPATAAPAPAVEPAVEPAPGVTFDAAVAEPTPPPVVAEPPKRPGKPAKKPAGKPAKDGAAPSRDTAYNPFE